MSLTTFIRIVALLSVLVLLASGAAAAGHHHEEDDIRHDCALCAVGSLNPFVGVQSAPSPRLVAAPSVLPASQGLSLGMLYGAHLLSRAPPLIGLRTPQIPCATASFVRDPRVQQL